MLNFKYLDSAGTIGVHISVGSAQPLSPYETVTWLHRHVEGALETEAVSAVHCAFCKSCSSVPVPCAKLSPSPCSSKAGSVLVGCCAVQTRLDQTKGLSRSSILSPTVDCTGCFRERHPAVGSYEIT